MMPILQPDLSMDVQSHMHEFISTKPVMIIEKVVSQNEMNMTTTGSSTKFNMLSGAQPLKIGTRLQSFMDSFSKKELEDARVRVANEELELGARLTLSRLRAQKGLSQTMLAQIIGKTQANMSLIERGHTDPRLRTIRKISDALGTSTDEVICAIETAEAPNA